MFYKKQTYADTRLEPGWHYELNCKHISNVYAAKIDNIRWQTISIKGFKPQFLMTTFRLPSQNQGRRFSHV